MHRLAHRRDGVDSKDHVAELHDSERQEEGRGRLLAIRLRRPEVGAIVGVSHLDEAPAQDTSAQPEHACVYTPQVVLVMDSIIHVPH